MASVTGIRRRPRKNPIQNKSTIEIEKEGLRVKASSARELNAALKALARYEENRFMREMGIKG